MSRPLQVGDYVRISLGDQTHAPAWYQVTAIDDKIYIQALDGPDRGTVSALYYDHETGTWRVYGTEVKYNLEFIQAAFPLIESLPQELVQQMALKLKLNDLYHLCASNRRLNSVLCADRRFWHLRYENDYGKTEHDREVDWKKKYQEKIFGNVYIFGSINPPLYSSEGIFGTKSLPGIKAKDISAGRNHIMILDIEGTVWVLGDVRAAGIHDSQGRMVKNPVRLHLPRVRSVAAGGYHSLVVTSTNEVFSFGSNIHGQLGLGGIKGKRIPTKIPSIRAKEVSAGTFHSLLIDLEGSVWVFGSNESGQLGISPTVYSQINRPQKVFELKAVSVSAGYKHSMLLDPDGDVWVFGDNESGQLGLGDSIPRDTPTKVPFRGKAKAISAGGKHSLILDTEGTVWAFGRNGRGQLGLGDTNDRNLPFPIEGIKARAIAAGAHYSVILDEEDNVWFSGPKKILTVSTTIYSTPTKIPGIKGIKIDSGGGDIVVIGHTE